MGVRLQVVFEGDSLAEIAATVRRWLETQPGGAGQDAPASDAQRRAELETVLKGINGEDSRRLLRELAEAAARGEGIRLDADLMARYGKSTGNAFGGVVGAANKVSRRIAHRDLILRDGTGGYRLDAADAAVVLELTAPGGR